MAYNNIFQTMIMVVMKSVNLDDVQIPNCTSCDFPRTFSNCANNCHVFCTIPLEVITESTSNWHQINSITELGSIGEGMSTIHKGIFKPPWVTFEYILLYYDALEVQHQTNSNTFSSYFMANISYSVVWVS